MKEDLKPCPFCKGKSVFQMGYDYGYAVECACGASGPYTDPDADNAKETAIKLWNKRE